MHPGTRAATVGTARQSGAATTCSCPDFELRPKALETCLCGRVRAAPRDHELTQTLHALIEASAAPLKSVESTFAVDTGFGTQDFFRHYTAKYGRELNQRDYMKLHPLIGTKPT